MILASSLIAPNGPIALTMFPGVDRVALETLVTARIATVYDDARIDDGENDAATQDKLARPLAIYTVLIEDVYPRMLVEPNSVKNDEKGASAYTDKQRADFLAWANGYLDQFTDLLPPEDQDAEGQWGTSVARRAS